MTAGYLLHTTGLRRRMPRCVALCALVLLSSLSRAQDVGPVDPHPLLAAGGLPVPPTPPPSPTDQIAAKYAALGGATGVLGSATSAVGHTTDGAVYFRHFLNGSIYWTGSGAHEIHGDIWRKYNALDGPSRLGYPVTDQLGAACGGYLNELRKGSAASTIYWKSGTGAFEVHGLIRDQYLALGGPCTVGYPTTDETPTKADTTGRFNHFDKDYSIYWHSATGAHEVHGAIRTKYLNLTGPDGALGFPVTDQTASGPWATVRSNRFQRGAIYWNLQGGAHEVHGLIYERWQALGGPNSWLGYPASDETVVLNFSGYGRFSRFDKGTIYYYPDSGAVEVKDLSEIFETAQINSGLRRTSGERPLLTIIMNTHTSPRDINPDLSDTNENSIPSPLDVEAVLFGTRSGKSVYLCGSVLCSDSTNGQKASVADYFNETTLGKVALKNAGILSYDAPSGKWGRHYWNDSLHTPCNNDGWLNGHEERVADAIRLADQIGHFDFKGYDRNKDGKLTPDELGILVLFPGQGNAWGNTRDVVGGYKIDGPCGAWGVSKKVLSADGVTITGVAGKQRLEWFAPAPAPMTLMQLGLPAHELEHLLAGADDLYPTKDSPSWKYDGGAYSVMSTNNSSCCSSHPDAFLKLKTGWLNYTVALGGGTYTLRNVEGYGEALVLYSRTRGRDEYFILEYRRPGVSYDAGRGSAAGGLPQAGVAVWHVIEDPALQKKMNPPGNAGWYRAGVLLQRADGGASLNDSKALATTLTGFPALTWSDGSVTNFTVTPLDPTDGPNPPAAVRLLITTMSVNVY